MAVWWRTQAVWDQAIMQAIVHIMGYAITSLQRAYTYSAQTVYSQKASRQRTARQKASMGATKSLRLS